MAVCDNGTVSVFNQWEILHTSPAAQALYKFVQIKFE